jgi:hypothetical protein
MHGGGDVVAVWRAWEQRPDGESVQGVVGGGFDESGRASWVGMSGMDGNDRKDEPLVREAGIDHAT